jgi:hypothetical protein
MFGYSRDKAIHHIDTLYYSVTLNEPEDIVKKQRENDLPANLDKFLSYMRKCKEEIKDFSEDKPYFGELSMERKSFSIYEYCVSLPECFDIFISSYLPTQETPRVVVQLRSRYLVLEGVKKAVEESFSYLREFLSPFGLLPLRVRENRIDYAFHTNLIQNPDKFFDDDKLRLHLKTNLRNFSKYGTTRDFRLDTLNLGRRSSNSIFFRAYNKGREMVEMNYKSFFIERWYRNGLISEFDKYVYETAYRMKAYRSGILVGRLKWYLEFGTDEKLKEECRQLLQTDFIRSDNFDHIEKKIHNVIPDVTLIFNVEYQVKRKFFSTCGQWLTFKRDLIEGMEIKENEGIPTEITFPQFCDPLLSHLFGIIFSGPEVVDYLTGFGNVVSFVSDRNLSFKRFKELGEPYMAWWRTLRGTKIDYGFSTVVDLYRSYDVKSSFDRSRRIFEGNVARLSMISKKDTEKKAFVEDMADIISILNDNDVYTGGISLSYEAITDEDGNIIGDLSRYDPRDYQEIRYRKARQLRGILKKDNKENNENEASAQESEEEEG